MRRKIFVGLVFATALLILTLPISASAQYRGSDRHDLRSALIRLDNSGARLESDLSFMRERRVFGVFVINGGRDEQVRDFRRSVRALRNASDDGLHMAGTRDEAQMVIDEGVRLERNLRNRGLNDRVDSDLV